MSRIGNKPIPVPSGVKIAIAADKIDVQGPKGKLSVAVPHGISFEQKDGILNVKRAADDHRAVHGLARALVANAVHGVALGFSLAQVSKRRKLWLQHQFAGYRDRQSASAFISAFALLWSALRIVRAFACIAPSATSTPRSLTIAPARRLSPPAPMTARP